MTNLDLNFVRISRQEESKEERRMDTAQNQLTMSREIRNIIK